MLCLVCKINEAVKNNTFGMLPCLDCQKRQSTLQIPESQVEFTTEDIKEDRKAYAEDIIQPHRGDTLSREYVEKYGKKGLGNISDAELAKAEPTWSKDEYYQKY